MLHRSDLSPDVLDRARRIRAFVLDVDGVLTDGSIVYEEGGKEIKRFHVWDGFAIRMAQRLGFHVAILSGRNSQVVAHRAAELEVADVYQGHLKKTPAFEEILARRGLVDAEVCVLGDDVPDLPLLLRAGLGIAPADAHPEVLRRAHYVTNCRGGRGAVREAIELVLDAQDRIGEVLDLFA